MQPVKVFLSYAHQDEVYKNELLEFLAPWQNKGEIEVWTDRAILVGDKWDDEISQALNASHLILFLISSSFLASSYINKIEIVKAMERHKENSVRLAPIMLRNCAIDDHVVPGAAYKIADFQGLPTDRKPIINWAVRDDAWMNVLQGLRPVVDKIKNT